MSEHELTVAASPKPSATRLQCLTLILIAFDRGTVNCCSCFRRYSWVGGAIQYDPPAQRQTRILCNNSVYLGGRSELFASDLLVRRLDEENRWRHISLQQH